MDLLEYQGKLLFQQHGIPVPAGVLIEEADEVALPDGEQFIVKAQVPAGKRAEHGGIRQVARREAVQEAHSMLGEEIDGETVRSVLVEEAVDIAHEHYLSLSVDRAGKAYTVVYSEQGGSGIETVADADPDAITRFTVTGDNDLEERVERLPDEVQAIVKQLYTVLREEDATLVEINPLVETESGDILAVDAKVRLDDNALYRHDHPFLPQEEDTGSDNPAGFVELEGDIAVIGNGAGLVMATLDSIHHFGGEPANFLDIGGGADTETMRESMRIVYEETAAGGVFINIFGGITRCDEVARGIIDFVDAEDAELPLVVRMVGTNQTEGQKLLEENGIHALDSMDACAEKIVELVSDD